MKKNGIVGTGFVLFLCKPMEGRFHTDAWTLERIQNYDRQILTTSRELPQVVWGYFDKAKTIVRGWDIKELLKEVVLNFEEHKNIEYSLEQLSNQ